MKKLIFMALLASVSYFAMISCDDKNDNPKPSFTVFYNDNDNGKITISEKNIITIIYTYDTQTSNITGMTAYINCEGMEFYNEDGEIMSKEEVVKTYNNGIDPNYSSVSYNGVMATITYREALYKQYGTRENVRLLYENENFLLVFPPIPIEAQCYEDESRHEFNDDNSIVHLL